MQWISRWVTSNIAHKMYCLPPPPQESAVTCCSYQSDCPAPLLAELEAAARTKKAASGWSGSAWPVSGGGEQRPTQPAHAEMLGEWVVVTRAGNEGSQRFNIHEECPY